MLKCQNVKVSNSPTAVPIWGNSPYANLPYGQFTSNTDNSP